MLRLLMAGLLGVVSAGCSVREPDPAAATQTLPAVRANGALVTSTQRPAATPAASSTPEPARPTATPTVDPDLVLPDLQTLPPIDLVIEIDPATGRKLLRLTNSIANGGPGALEVLGALDTTTGKIVVTQHVFLRDGSFEEYATGEFVFHPGHNHWHIENFTKYEVWSLRSSGVFDAVVAFTGKVSYCLRDNSRYGAVDAPARARYSQCERGIQGISPGWIDTYAFDTDGQIVDITGVPDGVYALRSTVDPANQLREADDTNNAATVYFELKGNRARVIESDDALNRLLQLGDQ